MIIDAAQRLSDLSEYYFSIKLRQVRALQAEGRDIINLGIGNPDFMPENAVINSLADDAAKADAHGYQPYKGIPELREAIAQFYSNIYQIDLDANSEVLPLLGSKEGIFYLSMAFLDPGDEVLVPDPGYPGYGAAAKLAGSIPVFYSLNKENNWLPNEQHLESLLSDRTRMLWINYPHMPTGAIASAENFNRLASFARKHRLLLCHDNPYSLVDTRKPVSILQSRENFDVAIELNSLSKSNNMAGWRAGMLCGAPEYLDAVLRVKSNVDSGQFRPIQKAAIAAMAGNLSDYRNQNTIYRERKNLIRKMLQPLGFQFANNSAGMFVWAETPPEIPDVEVYLDRILHECGVFIAPGKVFGTNGERYIRVSACADEAKIIEAKQRIHTTPGVVS